MSHTRALRLHAADRYLTRGLSAFERGQFEAHFFQCERCAHDVRIGEIFRAKRRAILKATCFGLEPDAAFFEKHPFEAIVSGAVRGAFSNPVAALATARYEAACLDLERQRLGRKGPPTTYYVRDRRTGERIRERDLNARG